MPSEHNLVLLEADAPADPFVLFSQWYLAAEAAELPEPSAMTLCTASGDGFPHARMVLMRGFDERGFKFYTNYQSYKAEQLAANPRAALVFFWAPLMRQIRISGQVEVLPAAESDAYFRSRPRGHRLGAHASPQSQVIPDRSVLEERLAEVIDRFGDSEDVPRPSHWGGYRVVPLHFEFWQGRENRLHDRLRYTRAGTDWLRERLAP